MLPSPGRFPHHLGCRYRLCACRGRAGDRLVPSAGLQRRLSQSLVLVLVGALLVAALLTGFGWWRLAGFVGTAKWRDLHVLWLPVLILVLPFLGGVRPMPTNELLTLVVGYAATAFFEEALYRGVVLGLLRPRGIWSAVIISSVLFGLVHLSNIALRGNPGLIALQALGEATVALVWPRSAWHAHDLACHWPTCAPRPVLSAR